MGRHKADVVNLLPNGNTLMEELMIPYIMYILLAIEPATYSSLPLDHSLGPRGVRKS